MVTERGEPVGSSGGQRKRAVRDADGPVGKGWCEEAKALLFSEYGLVQLSPFFHKAFIRELKRLKGS